MGIELDKKVAIRRGKKIKGREKIESLTSKRGDKITQENSRLKTVKT